MVDFHTHILPGMDDGSRHVSQSLEMLEMEKRYGVDTVILTPHFYSTENSPEKFLRRRQYCWDRLCSEWRPDMPQLLLGAEVQYFEGMGNVEDLPALCIEGTNLLLLEMPFCRWDDRMLRAVLDMNDSGKVRIVLAHIDRYLKFQPGKLWEMLRQRGILAQVNADFFDGWLRRRKAMSMLRRGQFQLIATDCHNLKSRRPDWDLVPQEAKTVAAKNARSLLAYYNRSL